MYRTTFSTILYLLKYWCVQRDNAGILSASWQGGAGNWVSSGIYTEITESIWEGH